MVVDNGGAGVDASSIEIYEDGELVDPGEDGKYSYDEMTGILHYCPDPGADVKLIVYDAAGNITVRNWDAKGQGGAVDYGVAINYPNPFDPAAGGTTIDTKFKGEVMVTIYDFAGDEVMSQRTDGDGKLFWRGYTADGEMVANGVYFAYCRAEDGRHKVVKIAVIRK
jgi:hypothetical protein